jgi:hypothetical protein
MKEYFHRKFHRLKISENHYLRKTIGVLLVIGGLLGFLPVLGYWMLPLGLALLAVDWPWARRASRHLTVWWGRLVQAYRRWRRG